MKAQKDQVQAAEKAEADAVALESFKIKLEGPDFWKQLIKDLHIAVESLSILDLSGTVSSVGNAYEEAFEVVVRKDGPFPAQLHTVLFYKPQDSIIRVHVSNGRNSKLSFVCDASKIALYCDHPRNPEGAAEYIVQPMAQLLTTQKAMSARSML